MVTLVMCDAMVVCVVCEGYDAFFKKNACLLKNCFNTVAINKFHPKLQNLNNITWMFTNRLERIRVFYNRTLWTKPSNSLIHGRLTYIQECENAFQNMQY